MAAHASLYFGYSFPLGYSTIPDEILSGWLDLYTQYCQEKHFNIKYVYIQDFRNKPKQLSEVAYFAEMYSSLHHSPLPGIEYLHEHKTSFVFYKQDQNYSYLRNEQPYRLHLIQGSETIGAENPAQRILQQCTIEGMVVRLPPGQLSRELYVEVKKLMTDAGGTWKGGKTQGFEFKEDPTEMIAQLGQGEKRNPKKEFQYFGTPDAVADRLVQLADVKPDHLILEPSAGQGAIVKAIHRQIGEVNVDCFELMSLNQIFLKKIPHTTFLGEDFLASDCHDHYDRIVANPPFSKNQDIDHVYKMYDCLKVGGRIATIMSKHWQLSKNKKETEFREFLGKNEAFVDEIQAGEFKESGTTIASCIVVIEKKSSRAEKKFVPGKKVKKTVPTTIPEQGGQEQEFTLEDVAAIGMMLLEQKGKIEKEEFKKAFKKRVEEGSIKLEELVRFVYLICEVNKKYPNLQDLYKLVTYDAKTNDDQIIKFNNAVVGRAINMDGKYLFAGKFFCCQECLTCFVAAEFSTNLEKGGVL